MAIVTEDRTWDWEQKQPTKETVSKQSIAVFDNAVVETPRTITVIRCESCGERLSYLNLTPDMEGNCPSCGQPLVVE